MDIALILGWLSANGILVSKHLGFQHCLGAEPEARARERALKNRQDSNNPLGEEVYIMIAGTLGTSGWMLLHPVALVPGCCNTRPL